MISVLHHFIVTENWAANKIQIKQNLPAHMKDVTMHWDIWYTFYYDSTGFQYDTTL